MSLRLFVKCYDCIDTTVPSEVPLCWEYCFTKTSNHKRFKILKFIHIVRHYIYMLSVQSSLHHSSFLNFICFYMGQCSLIFVFFSWFFHKFNKRYISTYYKSSCSDNLLTQSCLLIPLSHLVFRYSQHHYFVTQPLN